MFHNCLNNTNVTLHMGSYGSHISSSDDIVLETSAGTNQSEIHREIYFSHLTSHLPLVPPSRTIM